MKDKREKSIRMRIVHPNAAGIDVGSRSHYVSIGQGLDDIREFGVYSSDLIELVDWLLENKIDTVALESTGDYWQNLFTELNKANIKTYLVNGKYTKNPNKKKTDVLDCQHIQKLHSLGLLNASFLPDESTENLRTYCRHRLGLIDRKATANRRIQKFLKLLNLRLDIVVKDITGLTGMKIIRSIISGETDPQVLAKHRHYNCRKSEEEIAKALVSNGREDYLYCLRKEVKIFDFLSEEISELDERIGQVISNHIDSMEDVIDEAPSEKKHKRLNKNSLRTIDLNIASYQYFGGVDLLEIPGVSYSTVLTLMSEIGPEGLSKFPSSKHFTSWLRLAPNNKVSGGRVMSSKVQKGSNRLKIALRNAEYSITKLKGSPLHNFYKKIAFKKGGRKAITATARKLAVIIWNMITKKVSYQAKEKYLFLDQKRQQLAVLRKKLIKLGLDPNQHDVFSRPEYRERWLKKQLGDQGIK